MFYSIQCSIQSMIFVCLFLISIQYFFLFIQNGNCKLVMVFSLWKEQLTSIIHEVGLPGRLDARCHVNVVIDLYERLFNGTLTYIKCRSVDTIDMIVCLCVYSATSLVNNLIIMKYKKYIAIYARAFVTVYLHKGWSISMKVDLAIILFGISRKHKQ